MITWAYQLTNLWNAAANALTPPANLSPPIKRAIETAQYVANPFDWTPPDNMPGIVDVVKEPARVFEVEPDSPAETVVTVAKTALNPMALALIAGGVGLALWALSDD